MSVNIATLLSIYLVPMISLDQPTYEELENNSLAITVLRSGDLTLPITVYLTTAPILSDSVQNAAIGNMLWFDAYILHA